MKKDHSTIFVYSDGASNGKSHSPIGYGWVIVENDEVLMAGYGGDLSGTNNIAELSGAILGLGHCLEYEYFKNRKIILVSDSKYVLNTADGIYKPKKNLELCVTLRNLAKFLKIETLWVKGHSGHLYNTLVDKLAGLGKLKYTLERKALTLNAICYSEE